MDHIEDADVVIDFRGGKDAARTYRQRIEELKAELDKYKDALATKFDAEMCEVLEPIRAKIDTLKAENKELRKDLKERKGASGVLQQIADKLKSFTGEQNVWKAIEQLEAKKKRLRDALQSLYDEQNGPPLIRHEKDWQAAMDEAETLLGDN